MHLNTQSQNELISLKSERIDQTVLCNILDTVKNCTID